MKCSGSLIQTTILHYGKKILHSSDHVRIWLSSYSNLQIKDIPKNVNKQLWPYIHPLHSAQYPEYKWKLTLVVDLGLRSGILPNAKTMCAQDERKK
jgi:hypothetical protein